MSKSNEYRRRINLVSAQERREQFLNCKYVDSLPLYQSEDGETTDIEMALKTPLGHPILVGYSKEGVPSSCYDVKQKVSFNPCNPSMRQSALIARANLHDMVVRPNVYMDKLDAQKYCDDSIHAVAESLKNIQSKSE